MVEKGAQILAVVKEPRCKAKTQVIESGLDSFQKLVGGYIECIPFPGLDNVDIFLNEEGKLKDLTPNIWLPEYRDILMGTFFVVGLDEEEGDSVSLTEEQVVKVLKYINKNLV
mgnify:CR=1 FL=1